MGYNFTEIEKKWQARWIENKTYRVVEDKNKEKFYVLNMFPYPSGAGLHVGHPLGYIASDIYARYKRLQGYNVLNPMGYDAYGLPAEQYAIQTGQHPAVTTEQNINRYREQLDKIGFCFDWEREIRTCDADYYHWTQWAFIKMFNSYYNNDLCKAMPIAELREKFAANGTAGVNAACGKEIEFTLALCGLRPNYDAALTEYHRILEQKSRILKDRFENPALLDILPEYNTRLCQVGALLISYRARFYEALEYSAAKFHNQFSGGVENFTLDYKTVSTVKDPFAPISVVTNELMDHLDKHYRAELEAAQCLTGPHKDDFTVSLSGIDLKAYGSQGQTRTAAISLKLAQRELMGREWGEEPVLLLDDVLSELDPGRQDFVLNQIVSGQVFITCCEPGRFTKLGKTIEIHKGRII